MFDLDERVLCLKGGFGDMTTGSVHQRTLCPYIPHRGRIYTVSWIHENRKLIRLHELPNPVNSSGCIPMFYANRFVPIKNVDTDISEFTDLLVRAPTPGELVDWLDNAIADTLYEMLT